MKKICFIINSLGGGGAERVISVLASNLCKEFDVYIVLLINNNFIAYDIDKTVKIIQLDKYSNKIQQLFKTPVDLAKTMKKINADLYISFCTMENVMSLLANIKARRKLIISERNSPKTEQINHIFKILRKFLYPKADGYVFQTNDAKQYYSNGIQKKSYVIPNPVKYELPDAAYGSTKKICSVGRLFEQKNYPLLITTFSKFLKKYPDYNLEIYGKGSEEDSLKKLVSDLKITDRVYFKGFSQNVHDCIKDADFFVMTSNYEGMPNALLEALAMGLPCISSDCPVGGPKELIDNYLNGLLFEVGNSSDLLDKMLYFASHEEERIQMGIEAKNIKEKYSAKKISQMWIDVIEKYIK